MESKAENKGKLNIDRFALALLILYFGYLGLFKDMMEVGDSYQYLHQYPMREPVYSLLLQFVRLISGESYGILLGLIQNALAIICIYWAYKRLSLIYDMSPIVKGVTLALLVSPHIITPVASATHLTITSSVMTEGITISLYYVWFTMMLGILSDYYTESNLVGAYVCGYLLAMLLVMTRGQMILCLAIWMIVGVYRAYKGKDIKRILLFLLIVAVSIPAKSQLTRWYNLAETGFYVDTVSSKPMLMANIMYVARESDAEFIAEEDLREAFISILTKAKADGYTKDSAPDGLIARAKHHEASHEPLNFDYIDPAIRVVINNRYGINEDRFLELMIREDAICGDMAKELLPNIAGRYIENYCVIALLGFIRTVAIEKSILTIYALLFYVVAICLLVVAIIRQGLSKAVLSMMLVLIAVCGTVMGTALVIECITRYMIYNFAFIYIVILQLIISLSNKRKSHE